MPAPRRDSVEDYYTQLPEAARPHLRTLERLCCEELPDAEEVLAWNQPAFAQNGTRLVMLQSFSRHASLRFPTRFFAGVKARVNRAGQESGAGFVKLPYDRPVPEDLLRELLRVRLEEFLATGLGF